MTTTIQPEQLTEEERLLIISTPSRLAEYLTPKILGAKSYFQLDPWLALTEQVVIDSFLSEEETFVGVNAPSQCGKSTYCGLWLLVWILGHFPDTRIIHIAYSDSLAQRDGALVRDVLIAFGPELFGVTVDPDNASKGDWAMADHIGGMLSVGLGASITGRSGDFIHIDDLVKNMEEAASETVKKKIWNEYIGTVRTRLQPGGMILISATRFAVDDLTGRLKEQQTEKKAEDEPGDPWQWLAFQAIAEPTRDDPNRWHPDWRDPLLGRVRGEPLQTRFSKKSDARNPNGSYFCKVRRAFGTNRSAWKAIYQQDPFNAEGGMFPEEKWCYYDPDLPNDIPGFIAKRRVWDLAATADGGDWTSGALVGRTALGDFYVLDMQRVQLDPEKVQKLVKTTVLTDGYACPVMVEEERNGGGKHQTEFFRRYLAPAYVKPAKAEGTKTDRARPYSNMQQAHKVYLPKPADGDPPDWLEPFILEHAAMDGRGGSGRHDDMIDVVAHAINDMLDSGDTEVWNPGLEQVGAMAAASQMGASWYDR